MVHRASFAAAIHHLSFIILRIMAKNQQRNIQQKPAPRPKTAEQITEQTPSKNSWLPWAIGVLAITFLLFTPSLKSDFVNWDDPDNLYENELLSPFQSPADLNWKNFQPIFSFETGRVLGNYNPLPIASFAVEKAFFGLKKIDPKTKKESNNSRPFHLNNILLHLLVVFFAFRIMLELGIGKVGAAVGALLVGIHPMRVESVAWVTERKDVLFGAFFFATLFVYTRYAKRAMEGAKPLGIYILMIALMYFGCLAKVQMVMLSVSLFAIDFWLKRGWKLDIFIEKIPFFIISIYFGYLNIVGLTESKSLDDSLLNFGFLDRMAVASWSYFTYLYKLIVPIPMSPLYPYPAKMPWYTFAAIPIVLSIAAFWFFAFFKNRLPKLVFAIFFFTANVLLLLQFKAAGQGYLADRFTYVAYFGFFVFAAWAFDLIYHTKTGRSPAQIFGIGALAVFAFLNFNQQKIWKDGENLWSHVIKYEGKSSATAWANRAQIYRDRGDYDKALADFNVVINEITTKKPKSGDYNSRGKCYFDMAMSQKFPTRTGELLEKAMADYNKGVELVADSKDKEAQAELFINRGAAHGAFNRLPEAIADMGRGLELDPANKNGYLNRSLALYTMREYAKAADDYSKYIELDPFYPEIFYERGLCKMQMNDVPGAIADFSQAINLAKTKASNEDGLFFLERARALAAQGKKAEAQADIRAAQSRGMTPDADLQARMAQ